MNGYIQKVKSALITALVVMIVMQLLTAIITPYVPYVFGILLLVTVSGYLWYRVKKL